MAKAVSKLSIQVSANTMAVTKGFERINKSAKKLRGSLAASGGGGGLMGGLGSPGMLAGLTKAVPLLVGVGSAMLGVRAAARGIADAATRIDGLAKTSSKLGMTINALNGLRFAGEQTGVSANTMDMALQRMTRRLAEAAQGSGEAKDAIKQLGLDAQQLAQMSPDQAFLEITRAMKGVQQPSEKLRLAFKLFDSEGVSLVNTMAAGEAGIKKFMARAKELNGVAEEDAAVFEQFKDASNELGKAFQGLWQELGVLILPAVTKLLGVFTGIIKAVKDLFALFSTPAKPKDGPLSSLQKQQKRAQEMRKAEAAKAVKATQQNARKRVELEAKAAATIKARQDELLANLVEPALAQMRPGVGAVTRGTTAGFSAVQRGREAARTAVEQRRQMLAHAEKRRRLLEEIAKNTNPQNAGVQVQQVGIAP